ncbi:MAG: hypothetical protein L6243_06885 [Candidatus Altiarchaeales archaeon]|nr:hypothetical protein [Candidatus Altiarchaeota archaeon]MCG2783297.1 hypothetical protein [Candidatus Altiarchaeales archaeon]
MDPKNKHKDGVKRDIQNLSRMEDHNYDDEMWDDDEDDTYEECYTEEW